MTFLCEYSKHKLCYMNWTSVFKIFQLRDWNEELLSARELPKETMQQRLLRDRAIFKVCETIYNARNTSEKILLSCRTKIYHEYGWSEHITLYFEFANWGFLSFAFRSQVILFLLQPEVQWLLLMVMSWQ